MQYVLKTGFGESAESYGGTSSSPNSGLGQGSGASPPVFLALSSLIVNTYCNLGHGAKICSSYVGRLFHLSAVMYVDDTGLLHWPYSAHLDPGNLIAYVQQETMDYGHLAQAFGGILKEKKCSVYFMDYMYVRGWLRLKTLQELPPPRVYVNNNGRTYPSHICIPQPDSPNAPIETHNVSVASKMLGVHFSPAGNLGTHVDHMVQKGLDWVDCLRTKPLLSNDAWFSLNRQLFPAISWELVTVCMPPPTLDKCFQKVYEKALPLLRVNCKIKQEWRTLPKKYQGLAMPNVPLVALAEKVSFLLGNWGGFTGQAQSDTLAMTFDNFLLEVGLYGSPLDWSYEDDGNLSTESTWFHNLWTLLHYFEANITFPKEDTIQGLRENNHSLMSFFLCGLPRERPCLSQHCLLVL
jgi:hypothetical protein